MKSARIAGLDLAYSFSLLMIMAFSFSVVLSRSLHTIDNVSFPLSTSIFSGMFYFLCGMTVTIMMRGHRKSRSKLKGYLMKKGTIFFGMGLIFSVFWPVNIFISLGLFFILSSLLLQLNSGILWFLALITALISIALISFSGIDSSPEAFTANVTSAKLLEELMQFFILKDYYSIFPWFLFFLMGIVYGRYDFLKSSRIKMANIVGVLMIIAGIVIHLFTDSFFQKASQSAINFVIPFIDEPRVVLPAYLFVALGASVLFINFFLFLSIRFREKKWLRFLATIGKIKYSIYLMHILLGLTLAWLFNGFVFKSRLIISICVLCLILSTFLFTYYWRNNKFKKGPLENIIHRLAGTDD